jgi:acyl-CoA synthetase (AMP-forming)/AMP-acid ligase II
MLARVVDEAASRFGNATAYHAGYPLSYRQLAAASDLVALWLADTGITEGDVVALVLPPCPEYLVLYAAAAKMGAVTAGVNHRLTPDEQAAVVDRATPSLIVHAGRFPDASAPGVARVAVERASIGDDLFHGQLAAAGIRKGDRPAPLTEDPDRPITIVFTSGTTGTPKGAVFGGRQLEFITRTDTGGRWGGGGRQLAGTSLAHVGPMTKLPGVLMRGGTTFVTERWQADRALRMIEDLELSVVGGIPTQIALMLRRPDFEERDLRSVRAVVMGGGPATPALVREARAGFGAPVAIRYSCTEAGVGVGTGFGDPDEDAEVSVGRPHPGVELSIVDEHLEPSLPGAVGEICLRSPATMTGYWRDPARTDEAFTPTGAVRTGDLGRIDDQGRLRLVGRRKEMFVRGGYNVFPLEVEAVLGEHPGVAEVAVVPRSDEVMGEIGVAVVVPARNAVPPTLDALRDFGAARLARHKLPEQLVVTDALPLTPMEKVDRRALRALVDD